MGTIVAARTAPIATVFRNIIKIEISKSQLGHWHRGDEASVDQ